MNKKTTILALLFFTIAINKTVAQEVFHSINVGINNHFYKRLNYNISQPINRITQSLFFEYKFCHHDKNNKFNFNGSLNYRNNNFKYYIEEMGLFPDKIFITKTNRNQFGVAFSLLNNLKTKRSFSLEYYFGFGMLVSSNDLYKHLGDGEIQAIIYPTKYIDSIYYFLSSIHQNTISPTILGGIVLDKKIKNGLVFCIGVHFESGFVDSKSQFIVFKYYHHQGFNSTNYEFATSANASFVFTTGIKFSNTIFKKTKK